MRVSRILLLALVAASPLNAGEPRVVKMVQAACGAILRDDFNGPRLDAVRWTASSADPGIRVEVDRGELCIRGTSAEIPDSVLRKNLGVLSRYAGAYSNVFHQVDAALAVRVKMPSGISPDPGGHVVNVHLCGVQPDCYAEVLFGKCESAPMEKLIREYAGIDRAYQSARGWWFAVINQDPGRYWWRVSGEPLAESGDERGQYHEVLVDHDEATRLSRGFLNKGNEWIQLGAAETVVMGVTKVELKITNITPRHGTHREARFDDCRLYPNPRRNPVRFIVKTGGAPYRGERLRVELFTADGKHKVSEGYTDFQGLAYLPVHSPSWMAFPVSAQLRIFREEEELARGIIQAQGIEGLYPGDAWVFDTRQMQ